MHAQNVLLWTRVKTLILYLQLSSSWDAVC